MANAETSMPFRGGGAGRATPASRTRTVAPSPADDSGASPVSTTLLALRQDEVERARNFARLTTLLCVLSLGMQQLVGGEPYLHTATTAALVLFGSLSAVLWYRMRGPAEPFHLALLYVYGTAGVVVGIIFQVFMGLFSPMSAVIVLGVSFYSLGERGRSITGHVAFFIATYLVLALLTSFGVIRDQGVFAPDVSRAAHLTMTVFLTLIYAFAFVQGRASRRAAEDAIARAAEAARAAQQQEAQLFEVRHNLDVALRAVAGSKGPYTGTAAGGWMLGEIIGHGGMGDVYAARHKVTGQKAAVKLLRAWALRDLGLLRRFMRESEITAKLRGPNVVQVFDLGEAADGAPYIAMEHLVGRDLGSCLREEPRMPLAEVVTLVEDVARGLDLAHAAGVVHRDLKPQNIFRAERSSQPPTWTILDFGIAKLAGTSGTLTEGAILGTPEYMSPEQALGEESGKRADVYSLAAVAYRALTGRAPFWGRATPQVLYDLVHGSPFRPRDLVPELPRDVECVLAIGLARHEKDRFESATALAEALRSAQRSELYPPLRANALALLRARPWRT